MDIIIYSAGLEKQMRQRLEELNQTNASAAPDPISLSARRLAVIGEIMDELREFVYKYRFNSGEEEIKFFKEIKPVFSSQYFFQKEVYSISLVDSFMSTKEKARYYNSLLKNLLRYAKRHRDFYLYCMTGDRSNDDLYFRRPKKLGNPMKDRLFATDRDGDLATILAHVLIKDYLHQLLINLKAEQAFKSKLTWTGKKTDLIELVFALHAAGSFNNAEAEVKLISETFERVFNINLGNHYDYLQKFRARKKGQVVYLETLRSKLESRLQGLDS